jgi:hypothetical protein
VPKNIEIVKSPSCGNSPKNLFAQEFAIALSSLDLEHLIANVSDGVLFSFVGVSTFHGKEDFIGFAESGNIEDLEKICIHNVVTHGKAGAVNGTRFLKGGIREEFCDVYEFASARGNRIEKIASYVIRIGP